MEKIKHFVNSEKGRDVLIILIVILMGLSAFGLGRISKQNSASGIVLEYTDTADNTKIIAPVSEKNLPISISASNNADLSKQGFMASSRGKKYYPMNCSAGKNIVEANRIYFNTMEEAEQAGYTQSTSCRY